MAAFLAAQLMLYRRDLRRQRVFRDRTTPLDTMVDGELIGRYRLNRESIFKLIEELTPALKRETKRSHSISVTTQVLVALRFYASGTFQSLTADLHGISVPSASRIIHSVSREISRSKHRHLAISFPTTRERIVQTQAEFYAIRQFPQVIGCIDGTQVAIKPPSVNEHIYVCRKGFHSLNIQAVCDAKLRFTDVVAKYPGSSHDSFILRTCGIHTAFESGHFDQCLLLGDTGYPLKRWLMVPFLAPTTDGERKFNSSLKTTRCTIERAFGVAKSRFRCIHHKSGGCLMYTPERCINIIVACFKLHNFCINMGLPTPVLAEDEDNDDPIVYNGENNGNAVRTLLVRQKFS